MAAGKTPSNMMITVLSPEKELYKGAVTSVTLPGVEGEFQILRNHSPLVSALREGGVVIRRADDATVTLNIERGFVEVLHNEVSLLVQGATDVTGA